jgi:hypothetical protein
MPWTFSVGRRPSTNGFLANLRDDDPESSPLGHVINVEFDGLSSKLDLSKVTGVPGMSFKLCLGVGSTNAQPLFTTATPYADPDASGIEDINLGGFIFEPYNDGQYIVKTTWYRGFDVPGQNGTPTISPDFSTLTVTPSAFVATGDMDGAAISVLIDGITEDGYFADAKLFGSFAWTKTNPYAGSAMLGSTESETGTSYWFGTYLPVTDGEENYGTVGLEYNHGSEYWRPFTYAEDTLVGSKIATRGDAWEASYTYQINEALSFQARYTDISYDYTGSNGFFGNLSGNSAKISDIKEGYDQFLALGGQYTANGGVSTASLQTIGQNLGAAGVPAAQIPGTVQQLAQAALFAPNVVEAAQDFRLYLRYRF